MPRKFLDIILNRPSQTYALEAAHEEISAKSAGGSSTNRREQRSSPIDLPNAAAGPSSLLTASSGLRNGSPDNLSSRYKAASTVTAKGRFSPSERVARPYTRESYFDDGTSSIAESSATVFKRKRWWDTCSLRGFGKSARSRAGSVTGDSIFSGLPDRFNAGVAGLGSANAPALRSSRSDAGEATARRTRDRIALPFPADDAAALGAFTSRGQNIASIGQQLSAFNQHRLIKSSSRSDFRANNSMLLTTSTAPKRARTMSERSDRRGEIANMSSAISTGSSDWNDFMRSMSNREVAKAWTHKTSPQNDPHRRKSVVSRVQKELEQDAQYEQVLQNSRGVRDDLLARAAYTVVGSSSDQETIKCDTTGAKVPLLAPQSPVLRPCSIVSPTSSDQEVSGRDAASISLGLAVLQSSSQHSDLQHSVPLRVKSPALSHRYGEHQIDKVPISVQQNPYEALADPRVPTSSTSSSSGEDTDSNFSESESSEDNSRAQLDVVAEEDEETSSLGHCEMKPVARAAYVYRSPQARYCALQAAYRIGNHNHCTLDSNAGSAPSQLIRNAPGRAALASQETIGRAELQSPSVSPHDLAEATSATAHASKTSSPALQDWSSAGNTAAVASATDPDVAADKSTGGASISDLASSEYSTVSDEETDEQSGKDGEEPPLPPQSMEEATPVSQPGPIAPKTEQPKSPASGPADGAEDQKGSTQDAGGDSASDKDADIKTVSSQTTGKWSARTPSQSRPASAFQRRLSEVSLGTSFAFSHFMGSRMSGRSSSRKFRLHDESASSGSDGEASEEDEELKELALAEQMRLRSMSMGEDFFGGSLSDVLAKFGDLGTTSSSTSKANLLTEAAHSSGMTEEETQKAHAEAQDILNEVRRRQSAGEKDADRRTLQSEAGGTLAASLAAIWLLEQEQETLEESREAAAGVTVPVSNLSGVDLDPASGAVKHASVLNRPRFKPRKPKLMAGIPISQGKMSAESVKVPEDERSTLPSLSSWGSRLSNSTDIASVSPGKVRRRSLDLGDQKKSREKLPPTKSALKPCSLWQSKSLADTLLNFSTKKSVAASSKRARAVSIKSKGSVTSNEDSKTLKGVNLSEADVSQNDQADILESSTTALGLQTQVSLESSSTLSPVKVAGGKVHVVKPDTDFEQLVDGHILINPPSRKAEKGKSRALDQIEPGKVRHRRSASATTSSTGKTETPREQGAASGGDVTQTFVQSFTLHAYDSNVGHSDVDGSRSSLPSSEMWSERSGVSTALTSPSVAGAVPEIRVFTASGSGTSSEAQKTENDNRHEGSITMPPLLFLKKSESGPVEVSGEDRTPLAVPCDKPAFGVNVISSMPLVTSETAAPTPLKRSKSASLETPTLEKPQVLGDSSIGATVSKRSFSLSKRSEGGTLSKKSSEQRDSMLQAEAHELKLPPGLTATTVATLGGARRKSSAKKRSSNSRKHSSSSSALLTATVDSQSPPGVDNEIDTLNSLDAATLQVPPKELAVPSRVYAVSTQADRLGDSSLSSLSPPPSTASSSAGYPDDDMSPSRSATSRASSSSELRGSASNASNSAASSEIHCGSSSAGITNSHRARVRTQSLGPSVNKRGSAMAAIDEWASSSPVLQSSVSPLGGLSPNAGSRATSGSDSLAPSRAMSFSSVQSGASSSLVRNAPLGAATDAYLGLPVPRSRLSLEERARQHFDAQLAGSSITSTPHATPYARSLDGHGYNNILTQSGLTTSVAQSQNGHIAEAKISRYPDSLASGMSSYSDATSLSSLPAVPKSTYRPRDPIKAAGSSTIDDRLYQRSTMATVSVSSGAFKKEAKSLKRRNRVDAVSGVARSSVDQTPERLQDELSLTIMSLTAHTPPPRKVGSSQVLVQVIAVAIDEMDQMILREKVRSDSAYGWVPGRSFSGRIMEVGWEVKHLRKGDVVFGLQSNRKCGALAEFITIEQQLVSKAPEDCLTVEQIAALPSAGVLAFQVMQNYCANLPKGARILILSAHDGVGLLAMQECASLGPVIVAHCPASVSDGVAVCEANGAHEVVVGEALWAMNTLHESSFDLVLDTIGGRRLYDAARRILVTNGQFVTCFGDEHNSANPNFRSQMRSLRRTFFKKDKKNIGYEWIGVDTSEDCKEALEAVKAVAENGDICPRLRSILPFADAPRAFDPVLRGVYEEPGAVVVRVS